MHVVRARGADVTLVDHNLIPTLNGTAVERCPAIEANVVVLRGVTWIRISNSDADRLCRLIRVIYLAKEVARPVSVGGGHSLEFVAEPTKLVVLNRVEAHDGSLVLRVLCMRMNEKREGS